jgi:hypothetical protein
MKIGYFSTLLLAGMMVACHGSSSDDGLPPVGPAVVPWTAGAWTQPVPAWGSTTRISYPYPLDTLNLGDLGAFGAHEGGHPEGLDHVWLYNTTDDQVKSWADGTVTQVDVQSDQTMITIDYGNGLLGKHMSVQTAYVSVGQKVKAGDLVALGISGSLNNEFQLMDENRGDGIKTDTNGYSYVSPFDYLQPSQQAALVALYQAQVVTPFFALGQEVNSGKPWEPYLTNQTLIHHENRGTLMGEWVLSNRQWSTPDPLYYDILTIMDVTNTYGQFSRFDATDYNLSSPASKGIVDGSFTLTAQAGQVVFTYRGSATPNWYGLYSVDESSGRAIMKLEWSASGFPAAISSDAAVYYERAPVYVERDAQLLGVLP